MIGIFKIPYNNFKSNINTQCLKNLKNVYNLRLFCISKCHNNSKVSFENL